MALTIAIAPHPLLEIGAFVDAIRAAARRARRTVDDRASCSRRRRRAARVQSETVRTAVRATPPPRRLQARRVAASRPSEYLHAAHAEGRFPRINAAVDACNVASLCSGLPISLVDLDRLRRRARRSRRCPPGTSYVFNPSGQVIDASGLLGLFDAEGPDRHAGQGRAAHEDARRHAHDALDRVGHARAAGRTQKTTAWYRELVAMIPGATIEDVAVL